MRSSGSRVGSRCSASCWASIASRSCSGETRRSTPSPLQDLDPLGHRLTRARNNCYETLPLFAALALGASIAGRLDVTDPLAMWVLYTRIAQSLTHIASTSVPAVQLRATFFFAQILIYAWWTIRLLG